MREYGGLTRKQFGKLFRSMESTVYEWENGRCVPRLPKLLSISNYFGVSMDFILNGTAVRDNGLEAMIGRDMVPGVPFGTPEGSPEAKFMARFHKLPPQYRERVIGYLDAVCREAQV